MLTKILKILKKILCPNTENFNFQFWVKKTFKSSYFDLRSTEKQFLRPKKIFKIFRFLDFEKFQKFLKNLSNFFNFFFQNFSFFSYLLQVFRHGSHY